MRSCALRILLAATISIARVIFCVFLMLLIFLRISLPTAMGRTPLYQVDVALNFSTASRIFAAISSL